MLPIAPSSRKDSVRPLRAMALLLAITLCSLAANATVTLPALFQDHMVVQRNTPVHVWGHAAPGESISVSFRGKNRSTTADPLGRWSAYLPADSAGGPFVLQVSGSNRIQISDILVGDVWIASGQSNMEFPMAEGMNRGVNNEKAEIAAAQYPRIRLLDIQPRSSDSPLDDEVIRHPWSECTPQSVAQFSAVGYFFARDLQKHQDVPVGVIDVTWGGTPAEAWTSLDALSADASLMPVFAWRAKLMDELAAQDLEQSRLQKVYDRAKAEGRQAEPPPWRPDPNSWKPAGIYNAMIAPLTPFPIRGVIWYQGESNADPYAVGIYANLFQTLITDWRNQWREGDFPFLFVQIASWNPGDLWPQIREAQRKALSLTNTAMIVTIDIGDADNVHPKNKQDVGLRLSLAARAIEYGEHIEFAGPRLQTITGDGVQLRLHFSHTTGGLSARGGTLRGFEIAGEDGKYVAAQASIDGDDVLVSADSVTTPVQVRYGWAPNPDCNLYNEAGLPASPFEASAYHAAKP